MTRNKNNMLREKLLKFETGQHYVKGKPFLVKAKYSLATQGSEAEIQLEIPSHDHCVT